MTTLIYGAVFALSVAVLVPAVDASTRTGSENFPHIDSSVQFPETKARIVRHTFRLHLPQGSRAISQLKISVPAGLTVRDDISISDDSGQKIDTKVSVNSNQVILTFSQPLSPENTIKITMNKVIISGVSNAWMYQLTATLVGDNTDILLGIARVRSYQ
ncbi:DUF2808 domain-containing protein [Microcoleus sp. AT9b-C3]|uniref:DUF2808 domain-containing protein n=1 Tax=Microcoleus sp. AT9b-C3 TaxID=2818629 RepID=UPI002FD2CD5D